MRLEIRYHAAIPNFVKLDGLDIREVPEWEGGGFMVRKEQAEEIVRQRGEIERLQAELDCVNKRVQGLALTAEQYQAFHSGCRLLEQS